MASDDIDGFCIPYTIRDTADKGRGVFADAPVRKGTILWRFVRGRYAVYDERSLREFLAPLSRSEVIYELEHMFGAPEFPGYVIRVLDEGALINHSSQPNVAVNGIVSDDEIPYDTSVQNARDVEDALLNDRFALVAIRDLEVGDELTHDYNVGVADPPYYEALREQYDLSDPWL
ncbi:MAG: SET domain-containing protein [Deltaproteobacteria bacterium]|jgi:SET domain-containing protein|nr:SET domain-containing protein [Deltaproteobacteria bacterium]